LLDLDDPEAENRRRIRESAFSRFPVVQGGTQQVIGIAQAKDLLASCLGGQPFDLRGATRPPLYLPNTVTVLRVIEVFKTSGEPMALIVDEYGDLEGLVTPSDILEALVGDIPGSAEADQRIVRRDDGTWLIDGLLGLDLVAAFGLRLDLANETIHFAEKNADKAKDSVSKFLGLKDSESAQSAYDAYAKRLVNRRLLVPAGRVAKAVEAASQSGREGRAGRGEGC